MHPQRPVGSSEVQGYHRRPQGTDADLKGWALDHTAQNPDSWPVAQLKQKHWGAAPSLWIWARPLWLMPPTPSLLLKCLLPLGTSLSPCWSCQTQLESPLGGLVGEGLALGLGLCAVIVLCLWDQGAEAAPGAAPFFPPHGKQVAVSYEVRRVQRQMNSHQEQPLGVRVLQAAWGVPLLTP